MRCENVNGFSSKSFKTCYSHEWIKIKSIIPYSLKQNGVTKKKHETSRECKVYAKNGKLQSLYYSKENITIGYAQDRIPTRELWGSTPFEAWH